jgi:hypothetical protein
VGHDSGHGRRLLGHAPLWVHLVGVMLLLIFIAAVRSLFASDIVYRITRASPNVPGERGMWSLRTSVGGLLLHHQWYAALPANDGGSIPYHWSGRFGTRADSPHRSPRAFVSIAPDFSLRLPGRWRDSAYLHLYKHAVPDGGGYSLRIRFPYLLLALPFAALWASYWIIRIRRRISNPHAYGFPLDRAVS